MLKKLLLVFIFILSVQNFTFAKDVQVKLETLSKISTANVNMQEGDNLNLTVVEDVFLNSKLYIKKGATASGIITSLVNNDFTCQEASIYAENFKIKTVNGEVVKLKGIIYTKGRNHGLLTQFLPVGFVLIRGGEAQILPQKDEFTLYLEVKNEDL